MRKEEGSREGSGEVTRKEGSGGVMKEREGGGGRKGSSRQKPEAKKNPRQEAPGKGGE